MKIENKIEGTWTKWMRAEEEDDNDDNDIELINPKFNKNLNLQVNSNNFSLNI